MCRANSSHGDRRRGGGKGTHQVYIAGQLNHRLQDEDIVDHLVKLVEEKAAEVEAEKAANGESATSTTVAAAE